MERFKMRGDVLYDSKNSRIGLIRGDDIYDHRNHRLGSFRNDTVYDRTNARLAVVRGDKVYDSNNRRIGDLDDIRKEIKDAVGGLSLVALWIFFLR